MAASRRTPRSVTTGSLSCSDRDRIDLSRRHDVDFRLTIPLFVRDYYIAFVAGTERRDAERRSVERKKHPLFTLGNVAFLLGIGFCIWLYTKAITNWLTIMSMSN